MDYQTTFVLPIRLSEYGISEQKVRKTIRQSDIRYQTQTTGLLGIRYLKKIMTVHL